MRVTHTHADTRRHTHTHTHIYIYIYIHIYKYTHIQRVAWSTKRGVSPPLLSRTISIARWMIVRGCRGSVSHDALRVIPNKTCQYGHVPFTIAKKKTKTPTNNINNTLHVPLCSFILTNTFHGFACPGSGQASRNGSWVTWIEWIGFLNSAHGFVPGKVRRDDHQTNQAEPAGCVWK